MEGHGEHLRAHYGASFLAPTWWQSLFANVGLAVPNWRMPSAPKETTPRTPTLAFIPKMVKTMSALIGRALPAHSSAQWLQQ